jgi:hypothetical protein
MPYRRKLSSEEAEQYDQILADFEVGDYGELIPDPGESRLTARKRLRAAALRRRMFVTFIPPIGEKMHFKLIAANGYDMSSSNRR